VEIHKGAHTFKPRKGTVVTIGTFDGVHVGHQKIIQRLVQSAKANDLESVVLTFFPHPRMVLQKDTTLKLINTIDERARLLGNLGLDHLVIHPFTEAFSRYTADEYVKEILVDALQAKRVIIGYDHRFGRNRNANITELRAYGEQYDFEVEEISKQELDDVAISSTKVRKALEKGDIERGNSYLGVAFSITGEVVKGKQIGRTLGYPTANIKVPETYKLIPAQGVYVVSATIQDRVIYGMMNIGTNPTVGGTTQTIETYFFDFDQDLYGQTITISLLKYIRGEAHFTSVDALKEAMHKDASISKEFIATLQK